MARKRRPRAAPSELSGIFGGAAAQQPAHSPDPARRSLRRGLHERGLTRDALGSGPARQQGPHPAATPPSAGRRQAEPPSSGSAVSSVAGAVEDAGTAFFSPPRSGTRRGGRVREPRGPASPASRAGAAAAASSASLLDRTSSSVSHSADYSAARVAGSQGRPALPKSPRATLAPVLNVPGPAGLREFVRMLHQAQQVDASARGSFTARLTPPTLAYLARCVRAAAAAAPSSQSPATHALPGTDREPGSPGRVGTSRGKHWSPLRHGPPQHDYGPWLQAGLVAQDTPAVVLRQLRVESIRLWMLRGSVRRIAVVASDSDAGDTAHTATARPRLHDLVPFTGLTHLDLSGVDPSLLDGLRPLRSALHQLSVSRRRISAEELSRLLAATSAAQEAQQRDGAGASNAASVWRGSDSFHGASGGTPNGGVVGAASVDLSSGGGMSPSVGGGSSSWREEDAEAATSSGPHPRSGSLHTTDGGEDEEEEGEGKEEEGDEAGSDSYYSDEEGSAQAHSPGAAAKDDDNDSYYSGGEDAGASGAATASGSGAGDGSTVTAGAGAGASSADEADGGAGEAASLPRALWPEAGSSARAAERVPWRSLTSLSLTHLNLAAMPAGLRLMPRLRALDLSYNRLTEVPYVASCPTLARLNLSFNRIDGAALADERVGNVETLLLRGNCVTSSRGVHRLYGLKHLDFAHNLLAAPHHLQLLASLPLLSRLWIEGNPVAAAPGIRVRSAGLFHTQRMDAMGGFQLDGAPITEEETGQARKRGYIVNEGEIAVPSPPQPVPSWPVSTGRHLHPGPTSPAMSPVVSHVDSTGTGGASVNSLGEALDAMGTSPTLAAAAGPVGAVGTAAAAHSIGGAGTHGPSPRAQAHRRGRHARVVDLNNPGEGDARMAGRLRRRVEQRRRWKRRSRESLSEDLPPPPREGAPTGAVAGGDGGDDGGGRDGNGGDNAHDGANGINPYAGDSQAVTQPPRDQADISAWLAGEESTPPSQRDDAGDDSRLADAGEASGPHPAPHHTVHSPATVEEGESAAEDEEEDEEDGGLPMPGPARAVWYVGGAGAPFVDFTATLSSVNVALAPPGTGDGGVGEDETAAPPPTSAGEPPGWVQPWLLLQGTSFFARLQRRSLCVLDVVTDAPRVEIALSSLCDAAIEPKPRTHPGGAPTRTVAAMFHDGAADPRGPGASPWRLVLRLAVAVDHAPALERILRGAVAVNTRRICALECPSCDHVFVWPPPAARPAGDAPAGVAAEPCCPACTFPVVAVRSRAGANAHGHATSTSTADGSDDVGSSGGKGGATQGSGASAATGRSSPPLLQPPPMHLRAASDTVAMGEARSRSPRAQWAQRTGVRRQPREEGGRPSFLPPSPASSSSSAGGAHNAPFWPSNGADAGRGGEAGAAAASVRAASPGSSADAAPSVPAHMAAASSGADAGSLPPHIRRGGLHAASSTSPPPSSRSRTSAHSPPPFAVKHPSDHALVPPGRDEGRAWVPARKRTGSEPEGGSSHGAGGTAALPPVAVMAAPMPPGLPVVARGGVFVYTPPVVRERASSGGDAAAAGLPANAPRLRPGETCLAFLQRVVFAGCSPSDVQGPAGSLAHELVTSGNDAGSDAAEPDVAVQADAGGAVVGPSPAADPSQEEKAAEADLHGESSSQGDSAGSLRALRWLYPLDLVTDWLEALQDGGAHGTEVARFAAAFHRNRVTDVRATAYLRHWVHSEPADQGGAAREGARTPWTDKVAMHSDASLRSVLAQALEARRGAIREALGADALEEASSSESESDSDVQEEKEEGKAGGLGTGEGSGTHPRAHAPTTWEALGKRAAAEDEDEDEEDGLHWLRASTRPAETEKDTPASPAKKPRPRAQPSPHRLSTGGQPYPAEGRGGDARGVLLGFLQMPLAMGQRVTHGGDGEPVAGTSAGATGGAPSGEDRAPRFAWTQSSRRLSTGAGAAAGSAQDGTAKVLRRHSSLSLLRSPARDTAAAPNAGRSGAAEDAGHAARRPQPRAGPGVATVPTPNAKGERGYLAVVVTHVALYVVAPSPAPIPQHRALFDVATGTLIPPVEFPCTPTEERGNGAEGGPRRRTVCRALHPTQFRAWRCSPMVRVLACIPLHCVEALRLGVNGQWLRADTSLAAGPSSAGVALSLVTQERHAQAEAVSVLTLLVEGARRVAARVEVQDRTARMGAGADGDEDDDEDGYGEGNTEGELEHLAEGWGDCEVSQRDVVLVRRLQRALGLSADPKAGGKRSMGKALGMGKGGASDLSAVFAVHVRERGCEWGLRTVAVTDQALAVLEDSALVGDDPGDSSTPLPSLELELPFSAISRAGVVQGTSLLAIEMPSPNRMARFLKRKRVVHLRFGTPEQAADVARLIAQGSPQSIMKDKLRGRKS